MWFTFLPPQFPRKAGIQLWVTFGVTCIPLSPSHHPFCVLLAIIIWHYLIHWMENTLDPNRTAQEAHITAPNTVWNQRVACGPTHYKTKRSHDPVMTAISSPRRSKSTEYISGCDPAGPALSLALAAAYRAPPRYRHWTRVAPLTWYSRGQITFPRHCAASLYVWYKDTTSTPYTPSEYWSPFSLSRLSSNEWLNWPS